VLDKARNLILAPAKALINAAAKPLRPALDLAVAGLVKLAGPLAESLLFKPVGGAGGGSTVWVEVDASGQATAWVAMSPRQKLRVIARCKKRLMQRVEALERAATAQAKKLMSKDGKQVAAAAAMGPEVKKLTTDVQAEVNDKTNVDELEVGTCRNLADRSKKDGLTPDHIPSFASIRARRERKLRRTLDDAEARVLNDTSNAVVVSSSAHQAFSRTNGGRNSKSQVEEDSYDPSAAFLRDLAVWTPILVQLGHSPQAVAVTFSALDELNRRSRLYP